MQFELVATTEDELRAIRFGSSVPNLATLYEQIHISYWLWPCVYCERLTGKLACCFNDRLRTSFVCTGCFLLHRALLRRLARH